MSKIFHALTLVFLIFLTVPSRAEGLSPLWSQDPDRQVYGCLTETQNEGTRNIHLVYRHDGRMIAGMLGARVYDQVVHLSSQFAVGKIGVTGRILSAQSQQGAWIELPGEPWSVQAWPKNSVFSARGNYAAFFLYEDSSNSSVQSDSLSPLTGMVFEFDKHLSMTCTADASEVELQLARISNHDVMKEPKATPFFQVCRKIHQQKICAQVSYSADDRQVTIRDFSKPVYAKYAGYTVKGDFRFQNQKKVAQKICTIFSAGRTRVVDFLTQRTSGEAIVVDGAKGILAVRRSYAGFFGTGEERPMKQRTFQSVTCQ